MMMGALPTGTRLLVVEDEALIAAELVSRLERAGATVLGPVATADAAVSAAAAGRPDLVLMDIRLKGARDGIAAAEEINQRFDVPVVFLTANSDEATYERARMRAQYGYVLKPFQERELLMAITLGLHRHAMERELRRASLTHATISENVADAVLAIDALGRVIYVNPAAETLTGQGAAQLVGRPLELAILMFDEATMEPVSVATLTAAETPRELRGALALRHASGETIPVDLLHVPVLTPDGGNNGHVLTLHDMRAERSANAALRESEVRFRSAFDSAGVGMALLKPDWTFVRVNTSLCAMVGRDKRELESTSLPATVFAEDAGALAAALVDVRDSGPAGVQFESRLMHPRGEPVWVTISLAFLRGDDGRCCHIIAQVQNIDRQKRVIADLMSMHARYEQYEAALASLTLEQPGAERDAASALGAARDRITRTVAEALEVDRVGIWQLSEDGDTIECVSIHDANEPGRGVGTRLTPADVPTWFDGSNEAEQIFSWGASPSDSRDEQTTRALLEPLGFRAYLRAQVRLHGRRIGAISVAHRGVRRPWSPDEQSFLIAVSNLVAARYAQAEQRRVEERMRQGEKMAAIGQLAGGIAHDFNNLLTVIQGCSELLQQLLPAGAEDERELVASILESGQRATLLTRQLLLFSRTAPAAAQSLDVNASVTGLMSLLRRLIGEDIELSVELPALPGFVRIDPTQLEQVVMNLVVNARDAMPTGGRLSISTCEVAPAEVVSAAPPHLRLAGDSPFIRVTVRDEGVGITPDVLSRIFEPFFTTKAVGKGTGLGLATTYAIVEGVGGFVTVESELGLGSSFHIWLPLTTQTPQAMASMPGASDESGCHGTVLVVEDEAPLRRVVTRMLEQRGYQVLEADSAAAALEILESDGPTPDLLLTDVVMPGMSGGQLAERVRRDLPDLPVIFMSGYHDDAIVRGGVHDTRALLLHKPFSGEDVARAVAAALEGAPARP